MSAGHVEKLERVMDAELTWGNKAEPTIAAQGFKGSSQVNLEIDTEVGRILLTMHDHEAVLIVKTLMITLAEHGESEELLDLIQEVREDLGF